MTAEIYTKLKTVLGTVKGADNKALFKTITRYNAQIEHLLKEKNDEIPVLLPACFIQFENVVTTNLTGQKAQVQQASFDTILHMCWPIIKKDDASDLVGKQLTYAKMQVFEFAQGEPTCSRFTRTGEEPPDDESWVLVHKQRYYATLKDFSAVPSQLTGVVHTLTIEENILTSGIGSQIIGSTNTIN